MRRHRCRKRPALGDRDHAAVECIAPRSRLQVITHFERRRHVALVEQYQRDLGLATVLQHPVERGAVAFQLYVELQSALQRRCCRTQASNARQLLADWVGSGRIDFMRSPNSTPSRGTFSCCATRAANFVSFI